MLTTEIIPIAQNQADWDYLPMKNASFTEILRSRIDQDPDLTEAGLASKAGLDNSTIRIMLDRNTSPREATMRKIAAALGESLEQFMASQLDKEGKKVTGSRRVEVELYKIDWKWWWDKSEDNIYNYYSKNHKKHK